MWVMGWAMPAIGPAPLIGIFSLLQVRFAYNRATMKSLSYPSLTSDLNDRQLFRNELTKRQFDPEDPWIDGYVAYEWDHGRHVFQQSGIRLQQKRVLEFGCNIGATAIVLAHLGAVVDAVDVDATLVEIATLNASQYDLPHPIGFLHLPDTASLPFPDDFFDVVVCNSVLEYVTASQLSRVQAALARVLKTGGTLLVTGTSNRLSPREVHSRRWLVNYLPSAFDQFLTSKGSFQRGIWPRMIRNGFGPNFRNLDLLDRSRSYLIARRNMGASPWEIAMLATTAALARPFGWSVGMLTPNLCLRLEKLPPNDRVSSVP